MKPEAPASKPGKSGSSSLTLPIKRPSFIEVKYCLKTQIIKVNESTLRELFRLIKKKDLQRSVLKLSIAEGMG